MVSRFFAKKIQAETQLNARGAQFPQQQHYQNCLTFVTTKPAADTTMNTNKHIQHGLVAMTQACAPST